MKYNNCKRNYLLWGSLLTFSFLFQVLSAQEKATTNIYDELDSLYSYCSEQSLFNGHVLLAKDGEIKFSKTYGQLSNDSINEITETTPFLLASISKQFTAMAIVSLYSNRKLSYDDKVKNYIIDFPYDDITIRQLLNHTSGLKEYTGLINAQADLFFKNYNKTGEILDNAKLAELYARHQPPLDFDPGTQFYYSNTGYVYLSLIIEKVSGLTYGEFLSTKFFRPLNLEHTFVRSVESNRNTIDSYSRNYIESRNDKKTIPPFFLINGDGGVYSSANDLFEWFTALERGEVVPLEYLDEVYNTPHFDDGKSPYGYGWFVRNHPANGNQVLTHAGEFVGFTHAVFRDLDAGWIYISLSNNNHDINPQLNAAVVRILYGAPYELPDKNIEKWLTKTMIEKGISHLKERFTDKGSDSKNIPNERTINRVGYNFLKAEELSIAYDLLLWNTELYPESGNVYDSLGEVFLRMGDEENALLNYQKSLSIDQGNDNAREAIKKINESRK